MATESLPRCTTCGCNIVAHRDEKYECIICNCQSVSTYVEAPNFQCPECGYPPSKCGHGLGGVVYTCSCGHDYYQHNKGQTSCVLCRYGCDGWSPMIEQTFAEGLQQFYTWHKSNAGKLVMANDNIELSLLVIDMGDNCVVKVEKGFLGGGIFFPRNAAHSQEHYCYQKKADIIPKTFTEVRIAIDAMNHNPPVPRLAYNGGGYALHLASDRLDQPFKAVALSQSAGDALVSFIIRTKAGSGWRYIQTAACEDWLKIALRDQLRLRYQYKFGVT